MLFVSEITNVCSRCVWLFGAIIHCDHVWRQFHLRRSPFLVGSWSESRQTGKPKIRLRSWLANLINKRAPGDSLPSRGHMSVDVISTRWYVARENDAIGSDGDTCLIKLVVREIEREPWARVRIEAVEGSAGLVGTRWIHPSSGRMKGTPIITFPLWREKPWCEWRWYLFFKRDEIGEGARARSLFQRFSVAYARDVYLYTTQTRFPLTSAVLDYVSR